GQRRELAQLGDVEVAGLGHLGDRRAGTRGRQPGPLQGPGQPGLGVQHGLQPRDVARVGAAPSEDAPEQAPRARLLMVGHFRILSFLTGGTPAPGYPRHTTIDPPSSPIPDIAVPADRTSAVRPDDLWSEI